MKTDKWKTQNWKNSNGIEKLPWHWLKKKSLLKSAVLKCICKLKNKQIAKIKLQLKCNKNKRVSVEHIWWMWETGWLWDQLVKINK